MGEISEALRKAREQPPEDAAAREEAAARPAGAASLGAASLGADIRRGAALDRDASRETASRESGHTSVENPARAGSDLPVREVLAQAKEAERAYVEPPQQSISREPGIDRASARACVVDPHCDAAQGYRKLAFRIHSMLEESGHRSLVVTSTLAREGKTTTACNLAVELARVDQSRNVILVEMDLRRPMMSTSLRLQPIVGIEDVLADKAEVAEAIVRTDIQGLDVMMVRQAVMNPTEHFSSHRLTKFINALESKYGVVVIDTPPLVVGTDASVILRHADCGLLVAAAGVSPSRRIKQVAAQIPKHKFLGTVLNYAKTKTAKSEYDSYYYARPEASAEKDVPS